uniref:Sperm flagellar 2 n=1 Tax=Stegastes partitus TaxID=144197 RepID=A0A3B5AP37_9TELE
MSDILCRWLNRDLRLSRAVEPDTFANDFSSGYLIGEVLHKYQLQKDFSMFMKKDTSISKMNNFTRIEPTLKLLGISFDINTAQDLMQEKQGAATRLLHQLYVSLEKNKKAEIGGTMMEIMQPSASANLHKKEHEIYSDRLHQVVKRDAELKLQKIPQHYGDKSQQWCDRSVMNHPVHQKRRLRVQDEKQRKDSEKKFSDMNQATNVQVTKLPPYASTLNLKKRQQQQQQRKERQAQPSPADFLLGSSNQDCEVPGSGTNMMLQSNSKYIQEIRQRLEENAVACEQSKKRVDRFLVEQFKAHEAQKEAWREEQLVRRLTRQTRQEQGLAAQLLQTRAQKEVIRENRLFREQQYQQRREKDFREALDREAVLAQQAKLDRAEEIRKELEFCNRMAAERAHSRYEKHFKSCKDILEQIVDLATKVGEYRKLTGNLIPGKLMREWKELLFRGLPLFEPVKGHQPQFSTQLDPVELKKQETLNTQDYDEYTSMVGEWAWPEEAGETKLPPANNDILGHVVHRLRSVVHPPVMEPPVFPNFTIKACVLGKICSGKTTCLAKIAEAHGICVLSTDTLIEEAVNAYRNGEEVRDLQYISFISITFILIQARNFALKRFFRGVKSHKFLLCLQNLSTRAVQGAAAENELRKGKPLPNELLVDIVVEAISQVPAQSGWILDGFPVDISQAHLLEEALGGSVDAGNEAVSSQLNLAADPNPPKPPPPPAPVLDLALLLDVPDEITGFQENWPELEEWFGGKQNILVRVDADVDDDELYSRVESVLQQVMLEAQEGKWLSNSCFIIVLLRVMMQQLRSQRTDLNHHLYNVREGYKHYLRRPDLKQELVSQWQKDFNSVPDDMRKEDTNAELHLRLDELRERLWDISDKRKEKDEQERTALMCDRWLEEHTAVLVNQHSALIQVTVVISFFNSVPSSISLCVSGGLSCHTFCCSGLPSPPPAPSPAPADDRNSEKTQNAAKVRIALVKGHGLVMLHSLQSRAEQAFSSMEKWLAARYLAEMKRYGSVYDHVWYGVVRPCLHTVGSVELVLISECSDFYLNGDHHMVPDPAPPPHPPSPTQSTRTITQLESLHQKLCDIAPSGTYKGYTLQSFKHGCFLSCPQMMEIVSLLMDGYELIDWRRFLLSAALPWPFPSLTQLLAVRQRFKAADAGDAGYIHKEQYLQIELWFSHESVQTVPEDPPEPAPFDHLANLREFFFQLFADHSFSPSRLDYVSMLQYFAADPNPRQGFIRALSVVMGQHLQLSSLDHLVKVNYKEEEPLCASSSLFGEQGVSISALLAVICHKITEQKDDSPRPPGCLSREELTEVHPYKVNDLGYEPEDRVPFSVLSQHPFIQVLLETLTHYQLVVSLHESWSLKVLYK